MDKRAVIKRIQKALPRVQEDMSSGPGFGIYGRGLASEGYAGGYKDALNDVLLLLTSSATPRRRGFWDE